MALKDEFIRAGNWLFRWRSFLPLLLLTLFIIGLKDFNYPYGSQKLSILWQMFCLGVSFLGLTIRAVTIGYVPSGTSGRNTRKQVAGSLNTTGMYSIVRHPLYLGNYFIWLGISLFVRRWWLTLIITLIFWLYYERIMFAEEDFLQEKFGDSFSEWAAKTPAFIPRLQNWVKAELPFSFRNVLKREYGGFFAIMAIFTLLEVLSELFRSHQFKLELMWIIIFGLSLAIYLTLRTLKKHTKLLNVEGR
jgi:protein-S-isoprenylcysteine O-methyltransferase Ste14